jgi:hypothetical protein
MCVNLLWLYRRFWQVFFESLSKSKLCVKCSQVGSGSGFQAVSLAFIVPAQHSVHPTGGSLRVFKPLCDLRLVPSKWRYLVPPTSPHQGATLWVTHTVRWLNAGHVMKQFRWMIVMVVMGILSACGEQVSTISQPSTSTNSPKTAEAYLIRGDNFSAIKDYGHAIQDYDQAIRLNPKYAEAYNNRGYAYYWNYEVEKAVADYSQAIKLRPDYAYAYNNRGAAYMMSGDSEQAIRDFNRAIALQPNFPQAHTNRGNAYLHLGRFGLAFADFRRGGANPVRTIVLLCAIPTTMILLGAVIMNFVRQRLLAKRRQIIKME